MTFLAQQKSGHWVCYSVHQDRLHKISTVLADKIVTFGNSDCMGQDHACGQAHN